MTDEWLGGKDNKEVVKWLLAFAIFSSFFLFPGTGVLLVFLVAAGAWYYFVTKGKLEDETSNAEPVSGSGSDTTATSVASSLVRGPEGRVRAAVPEGMEGYSAEYVVYATTRRPVTVELERASEPSPYAELLGRVAGVLGVGEEVFGADEELPERVLHEARRVVRSDADSGKVRVETGVDEGRHEAGSPANARVEIGRCVVKADEEGYGFEYSVSYDSTLFDREEEGAAETDKSSL